MKDQIVDVVLVGAGIMSATLGTLLHKLDPNLTIQIYERLDHAAAESSDAWNNAGTGHAAFCELNYTPQDESGEVDIRKALRIAEQFELSKQFWASLVVSNELPDPNQFIRQVPHLSFVSGAQNVNFLRSRFETMQQSPLFEGMQFTTDRTTITQWAPLMMQGRDPAQPVAATKMSIGNDVNFGGLTRALIQGLDQQAAIECFYGQEVRDFRYKQDKVWRLKVHNLEDHSEQIVRARFVFIGAGGGALELLDASGIPQGDGYGGFPVSGQWLRCTNPQVIAQHQAKVYGKAAVNAPPMSVPHLDTRWIDGEQQLLFGPYAGFSTKFLKQGSYLDLFKSLDIDNIVPILSAGFDNLDLTRYLIGQVLLDKDERMDMLRESFPQAQAEDWELQIAGQRVQIIKRDENRGGVLQFGTEIVTSTDGNLAALLGASPGASTAVAIMLDLLKRCFPQQMASKQWQATLSDLLPSFGHDMANNQKLCADVRAQSLQRLQLAG